jgi:hypothetical protein
VEVAADHDPAFLAELVGGRDVFRFRQFAGFHVGSRFYGEGMGLRGRGGAVVAAAAAGDGGRGDRCGQEQGKELGR